MTEREEFEAWASGKYSTRYIGVWMDRTADAYESTKLAEAAWDGWQAARRTVSNAQAECGKSSVGISRSHWLQLFQKHFEVKSTWDDGVPREIVDSDGYGFNSFRQEIESLIAAPQHSAKLRPEDVGLPPYPKGDVKGPCVCGSWPGGECLRCQVVAPQHSANTDCNVSEYSSRVCERGTKSCNTEHSADIAAMRLDAERYRWLRDTMHSAKGGAFVGVNESLIYYETPEPGKEVQIQWYPNTPVGFYLAEGSTLDAAIDTALQAKGVAE